MTEVKTIVICGPFKFPYGDAGANRVLEIAKTLRLANRKVLVIGTGTLRKEDRVSDGTFCCEGITYDSIYNEDIKKLYRACKLLTGGIAYLSVINKHKIKAVEAIISYGGYVSGNYLLFPIVKWIRKEKFIVDVVEWYSPEQFKYRYFNFSYIDAQIGVRFLYPRVKNLITISKFLEKYYREMGCNVVNIPPLTSLSDESYPKSKKIIENRGKLKLIYAGSIGKKDFLDKILIGLSLLSSEKIKMIEMNIYGSTEREIEKYMDKNKLAFNKIRHSVFVHGKVKKSDVLKAISNSHFTVLLRPQQRYSQAGFPSKIPESLALGTPVILNYSSDLALYIKNEVEGLVVQDFTPEAFAETINDALNLDETKVNFMREMAKEKAITCFHPLKFFDKMNKFLKEIK
ncbi:glycosyltransferase [Planococcus sp. N028]|uniref:Glycosyltransferase n=1 Tax=Planococcus shixiaomingii TaxID=3058393 RepID=A0ABT8N1E1_9BACL|nr:glycosyltransferase [Planococcus sp. N028]MDN7241708.1 glycosyltransferase [Planococcus sp. N028]